MLTSDEIDGLTFGITKLYEDFAEEVIKDISRRVGKLDYAKPTAALQVQRLNEAGLLYEEILNRVGNLTGKSDAELRKMFHDAGVKSMKFDDKIYKAAGLDPLPLNLSPAMVDVLKAGLAKTGGVIRNLTKTTALAGQEAYIAATDLAYMHISSGTLGYDEAVKRAVKKVAADGAKVITFPGRKDQIDVAVRRAAITGVSQTAGQLQWARADEMNQDLVQVSAHVGARNEGTGIRNHEGWQGKVYSRTGSSPEHPNLISATGYGSGDGLMGWNCRHHYFPFFPGISEEHYKEAELQNYADKKVKYNGKELSFYDGTQVQRSIEREIRHWKRQASALGAAGRDNLFERTKVAAAQAKMRNFIKQTGLVRQPAREGGRIVKLEGPPTPPEATPSWGRIFPPDSQPPVSPGLSPNPESSPDLGGLFSSKFVPSKTPTPQSLPSWMKEPISVPKVVTPTPPPVSLPKSSPDVFEIKIGDVVDVTKIPPGDFGDPKKWRKVGTTEYRRIQTDPVKVGQVFDLEGIPYDEFDASGRLLRPDLWERVGDTDQFMRVPDRGLPPQKPAYVFPKEFYKEFEFDPNLKVFNLVHEPPKKFYNARGVLEFPANRFQGIPPHIPIPAIGDPAFLQFDEAAQQWVNKGKNKARLLSIAKRQAPTSVQIKKGSRTSSDGTTIEPTTERLAADGAFDSARVHISGNGDAVLKTNIESSGWGPYNMTEGFARREVMASELDEVLQLGVVPKTTAFVEGGEYRSLQRFVTNAKMRGEIDRIDWKALAPTIDPQDPGRMMLLDMITANTDRHSYNWMVANGRLHAIDNGLTMTSTMDAKRAFTQSRFDGDEFKSASRKFKLSPDYRDNLEKAYKDGTFEKMFNNITMGDPAADKEIADAALNRVKQILADWDNYFYWP